MLLSVLAGAGVGGAARAASKGIRESGPVEYVDGVLTVQKDAVALLLKRASEMHDLGVILRGSNEMIFYSLA